MTPIAGQKPRWRRRSRSALTLVELLVVLAIISLLVGMITPAAGTALRTARSVACRNNLRQIGMALTALVADEGLYPAEGHKGLPPERSAAWFVLLPSYLGERDVRRAHGVFQCPATHFETPIYFDQASPKSFKWNGRLDDRGRPSRYRPGSVPDESSVLLMADAVAGETGMGQWGHLTPGGIEWRRHGGQVNVLYLDGSTLGSVRGDEHSDWEEILRWLPDGWE